MQARLQRLARLAGQPTPTAKDVVRAATAVGRYLGAAEAYVIRSGDPHFIRIGCPCPTDQYEIKQRGYWIIWRTLASDPSTTVAAVQAQGGYVLECAPASPSAPATHVAMILPGYESNSELFIARGPWPKGVGTRNLRFLEIARPLLASLVASHLDVTRRERQQLQLQALADVAAAFNDAEDREAVLTRLATALAKASGYDWVTITVYSDDLERIVDVAQNIHRHSDTETASGYLQGRFGTAISPRGNTALGKILVERGEPWLVPDVFADPDSPELRLFGDVRAWQKFYERAHILSLAVFPLVYQGRPLGTVSFSSSIKRSFPKSEVEFLQALVSQAATAVKGVQLYRNLQEWREELARREERFRSLVQNAADLITVVSPDSTIQYQSPAVAHVLGYVPDEFVGTRLIEYVHPADSPVLASAFEDIVEGGARRFELEIRLKHRDGSWRHLEVVATDQRENPAIGGLVLNMHDVTERKRLEEQLRHQALNDPLTGLANRASFTDRLRRALAHAHRTQTHVAVVFVDLDDFKGINDSMGHSAGDLVLLDVATKLRAAVRASDTVARFGGDEFAILLEEIEDLADAESVTERILEAVTAPTLVEGKEVFVRASAGLALSGHNGAGTDAETLLQHADVAMYVAKARGKGTYAVFEQHMQAHVTQQTELVAELHQAIGRGELFLAYQPLVRLRGRQIYGFEALLRWHHRERGLISPAEFIPLAEQSGAIVPIGNWVLQQACNQAASWSRAHPESGPWTMSVNISARQIQHPNFVNDVRRIVMESGFDPRRLILELTESVLVVDPDVVLERLMKVKELGIRLAIDDFGTGSSSLSYLRRFPFDLLKIDRTFIEDLTGDGVDREITHAIIELGRTLRLELVAEGIEDAEQLSRLQRLRCDLGQGFLFARPLPASDAEAFLARFSRRQRRAA
jgi:diguanylate cyclase (GGDEF)-like protein/PAS domain S-box-containing protein